VDEGLLSSFRFEVKLMRSPDIVAGSQPLPGADVPAAGSTELLGNGAFQDCTGLEIEMDVQEYVEGGRNNGTVRRVGRAKFAPLVLKRGMFWGREHDGQVDPRLWQWLQGITGGERPVRRFDGLVYLMASDGSVRATWSFDRGLPSKLRGPELNARTGEVAIEELTIAHEGLRLMAAGGGPQ
jgi:phage tail-like protein